jgi:hypothetical protein
MSDDIHRKEESIPIIEGLFMEAPIKNGSREVYMKKFREIIKNIPLKNYKDTIHGRSNK